MAVALANSGCNQGYEPMGVLRLLHYPPQPADPAPGEKGCAAHTDWGCLTLLWLDPAGVAGAVRGRVDRCAAGAWGLRGEYRGHARAVDQRAVTIDAAPGDQPVGRNRYSMPFFFEDAPGHVVTALPGCVGAGEVPLFAPITVSAHLAEMYRLTYAR